MCIEKVKLVVWVECFVKGEGVKDEKIVDVLCEFVVKLLM